MLDGVRGAQSRRRERADQAPDAPEQPAGRRLGRRRRRRRSPTSTARPSGSRGSARPRRSAGSTSCEGPRSTGSTGPTASAYELGRPAAVPGPPGRDDPPGRLHLADEAADGGRHDQRRAADRIPKGEIVGAVVVANDITERKRLENELAISEARFRGIIAKSPVMIWKADQAGDRDFFNETWLEFRGRSLDEEIGEGWAEGVHPRGPRPLPGDLPAERSSVASPSRCVYRLLHRDGRLPMGHRPGVALPRRPGDVPRLPRLVHGHHRPGSSWRPSSSSSRSTRAG